MQENDYSFYDYFKPILIGSFISLLSTSILIFIVSLLMTKVDIPFSAVSPIAVIVIGFSTFLGSFIGAKRFGKRGFFIGLCVSLTVFLIILLVNLSIEPQGFGTIALTKGIVTLVSGILGGIFGVNKKRSAKFKI